MVCTDYDGLVLSGGAARGAAFLGALHKLRRDGALHNVKAMSGTSIGALAVVLCAQKRDMIAALRQIAARPFQLAFDLISVEAPFGVDSGTDLHNYITGLVGEETMQQLVTRTGINVVICATSLLQRKPVYLTAATHPDMQVAWAVRLSCTLPLIFAYGLHAEEAFVDGGLSDNFPTQPLSDLGCKKVLGIRFKQADPHGLPRTLTEYILTLMSCVAWQAQNDDTFCHTLIELDVPAESAFDFSMPMCSLKVLFKLGFTAV